MKYISFDDVKGWQTHKQLPDYRVDWDSDTPRPYSGITADIEHVNRTLEGEGYKIIGLLLEKVR